MTSKSEVWKAHPDIDRIEVSTFGRVRSLKGHYYGINPGKNGYMKVGFRVNGKVVSKLAHRLVAETFLPNPGNLPQVNHKDCNPQNNNVENLEWCTSSYDAKYREKYGISRLEAQGQPLFAVNLDTLEVSHFRGQGEASRALGVNKGNINSVIKGKYKQTGGFWFKADDGNGIEIDKDKLNDIVNGMCFRGGVFAVNLNTSEVSRFKSQAEASRELGIHHSNINAVIKGRLKQTGGFWFTNADDKADDAIKRKLNEIKKIYS